VYIFYMIIWFVYCIGLIYPDVERYTYYNEIFSLLGVFLCLSYLVSKFGRFTKVDYVYYLLIIYGLLLVVLSYDDIIKNGAYLSLRTMPVYYSMFVFVVGFNAHHFYLRKKSTLNLSWWRHFNLFVSILTPWRLSPQVFAMYNLRTFQGVFLYLLLFAIVNGGATSVTAFGVLFIFYAYKRHGLMKELFSKNTVYALLLMFVVLLGFSGDLYNEFSDIGYEGLYAIDPNFTWRYMYWVYLYQEVISNNILTGIGFGAPLFELGDVPRFITTDDGSRNTGYTLGTHNSLVYLLARMGLVGAVLLVWLHVLIYMKAFALVDKSSKIFSEVEIYLLGCIMFLNSALFNVVLESPLYAGLYWFALGVLYSSTMQAGSKENIRVR